MKRPPVETTPAVLPERHPWSPADTARSVPTHMSSVRAARLDAHNAGLMGQAALSSEQRSRKLPAKRKALIVAAAALLLTFAIMHTSDPRRDPPAQLPETFLGLPMQGDGGAAAHMIMVAGHAVLTAQDTSRVDDEDSWFLQPSQKGQLAVYLRHIEHGVELAARDPQAWLVFSGGQTREEAGPRSEGWSYWTAANAKGWFGNPEVRKRAVLEEYARDSYENLLFSLCRFREALGRYPTRVTVVSYGYKRPRFADLHRAAVRYPEKQFVFEGVDPPAHPYDDSINIRRFTVDPYGCTANKELRMQRNPFRRNVPYSLPSACPELRRLLAYCGPELFPTRALPWGAG